MAISSSISAERDAARAADDWWGEVRAVLAKDIRSELRTKSALGTILIFSLTVMVLVSITVVTTGLGFTQGIAESLTERERERAGGTVLVGQDTRARATLLATLYWIILYFSAMAGLPRVFVKEEEMRTGPALRLAARPSAVYTGKLAFNLGLLLAVSLVLLLPFLLFFTPHVESWPLLLAYVVTGSLAMAGAATLLGAIVARASNQGYLMAVLGFGPLLPVLVFAINGTTAALYPTSGNYLVALVSYLVVMITVSGLLFERVWSD